MPIPVAGPIAPPPVPSTEEKGAWQLNWVWIPSSVNPPSSAAAGPAPVTPPKAAPAEPAKAVKGSARRRLRSPLRRRILKPTSANASCFSCSSLEVVGERIQYLCEISFASAIKTQKKILELGRDFERALSRPLHSLNFVPCKFTENTASRPSLTGNLQSKAELVRELGCCYFVDDQRDLLRDISSLQEGRSRAHRVRTVQADCELPSGSLKPLMFFFLRAPFGACPLVAAFEL